MDNFEKTYGNFLDFTFRILNPFKKAIIRTECKVHQFINVQALQILRNDLYQSEYDFFNHFIKSINEGAVWADQDFKSSGHFYNPDHKKGLYGRRNAMGLAKEYHEEALEQWAGGEYEKSLFYVGAALHLVQDMVVPQHANIRLLDNHRQYENFVIKTYLHADDYQVETGAYLLETIEAYIKFNARVALQVYKRFKGIADDEQRYYRITRCIMPLAQRTTAGCMVMFYGDMIRTSKLTQLLH